MAGFRKLPPGILAVYRYLDDLTHAMQAIEPRPDFKNHVVLSPTSYHELIDLAEKKFGVSQVRWFTLTGGLTGVCTGFGLPLWMDYDWPIIVGGKTPGIYSVIAYVVLGFELTILFGAIATICGMFIMGRFPDPLAPVLDDRLMDDHFGIFVPGVDVGSEQAKLLKSFGAVEIKATT